MEVAVTSTKAPDDSEPVLVMVFADDPSLWHHGLLQYTRMKASRTPVAERLIRMVPGRYRVIAIHDPDVSFLTNAPAILEKLRPYATPITLVDISYPDETAILEKLRPLATPVTLVAGETPKISLGVAKLVR